MTSAAPASPVSRSRQGEADRNARVVWLEETVSDLRSNSRDLRLVLGFMERDSTALRRELDIEKARNASLQERILSSGEELRRVRKRNEVLEELIELKSKGEDSVLGQVHNGSYFATIATCLSTP